MLITGLLDAYAILFGIAGGLIVEIMLRLRGPLEAMLIVSLVVALVALTIWFFFLAAEPPRQVI
jgi:hypothetical protein